MKMGTLAIAKPQSRPFYGRLNLQTLFLSLFIALVGFVVFTPLLFLIYASFEAVMPGGTTVFTLEGWRQALTAPGIVNAIYNSFALAIARQSIAITVGILLAWLIARTDLPMRGWFEVFVLAVLLHPGLAGRPRVDFTSGS